MLQPFNKSTKAIVFFLVFNFLATALSIYLEFSNYINNSLTLSYSQVIFSIFILWLCIYLMLQLRRVNMKILNLCFWFCLLQTVTIKNDIFTFSLNYGAKVGAAFEIGNTVITINFLALLALFLIRKMIHTLKNENEHHLET